LADCDEWKNQLCGGVRIDWVAVGCSPYFGALYQRHRARGKKANTAITIVARRMCKIVWSILTEQRAWRAQPKTTSPAAPVVA
jgi:hypothetical protein